jgi:hypothetical protein
MAFEELIIKSLSRRIMERESRAVISFKDFLNSGVDRPAYISRSIFQMLYDMIKTYVGEGIDEYPDDPESTSYVYYDCAKLFVEGTDHPFFADRLFANRLINLFASLRHGAASRIGSTSSRDLTAAVKLPF